MVALELFFGMVIAGLGALLAAVGVAAWRRTALRKMLLTAFAFACAAAGGAAYTVLLLVQGLQSATAPTALAVGIVATLVVFYFALFGRSD